MKKLITPLVFCIVVGSSAQAQTRYIDEVFGSFDSISSILYGSNLSVLGASQGFPYIETGTFGIPALELDFYEPTGDSELERPLIIFLHTGTFAPIIYNGNPTGMRQDFATERMCQSLARRGYAVANLEYRLGWNPTAPTQAEKAASLMKAVYRAIQDVKGAVRYFRDDYENNGNSYRIDTSRIVLCGQGSGGWIALGYATIDKLSEIQLPKFLDLTDPLNPIPLIDTADIGDWDGYGGTYNYENYPGFSNDVHMVCSMGGGIGDLSWLEAGDVPITAVHCPTDPVAIYTTGDVSVSQIGVVTTDISGSHDVMNKANALDNNDVLWNAYINDVYTTAAENASMAAEGMTDYGGTVIGPIERHLFPFMTQNPFEASPWDFWDSTTVMYITTVVLGLDPQLGIDAHQSGLAQNPDMSVSKSMAYMDSTLGFFCPRIAITTGLVASVGLEENASSSIELYPNPTSNNLRIIAKDELIHSIIIYAANGAEVYSMENVDQNSIVLNNLNLDSGIYHCTIELDSQKITKRIVIE